MTPLLEVSNLRTYFHTRDRGVARAVDGVDFTLDRGEMLGIVGESGSGKSVTSLSVMRLVREPGRIMPGSSIRFRGRELLELPESEMRRIRGDDIGMIFQEPMTSLNPVYSVGDQIAESLRVHRGQGRSAARARAVELLRLVGIPNPDERVDDHPHQLSGGQRQRVMIAIALACEPDLLIADEPTTALDVTIQAQILELLAELRERLGMAVVLITHDLGVVAEVCDRVVVMYAGQVMEEASVEAVFERPRHPYTRGLLAAIPRLGRRADRLAVVPGTVPNAIAWPVGCRFHPRCPYGWELCVREMPELFATGEKDAAAARGPAGAEGAAPSEPARAHRSRCWLEKHPEREEEVERTTGAYATDRAEPTTPAEEFHRDAAAAHGEEAPEPEPPTAPPRPLAEDPDVEEDVER